MNQLLYTTLAFVGIVIIYSAYIIQRQQRTIDRLTDKLMARDYREYRVYGKADEKPAEEEKDKLSFYDQ